MYDIGLNFDLNYFYIYLIYLSLKDKCICFLLFCFIFRFIFKNKSNVIVWIINYGGIIIDIFFLDKNGKVVDINLGFDDIKGIFEL